MKTTGQKLADAIIRGNVLYDTEGNPLFVEVDTVERMRDSLIKNFKVTGRLAHGRTKNYGSTESRFVSIVD